MDTNDPNYSPYSNGFSGITGLPSPEDARAFRDRAEQKRVEVRHKLDQLSQAVLDVIHEEQVFTSSPQYARMTKLADNPQASDEEVNKTFDEMKDAEGGVSGFADFILKAMDLPVRRRQAVQAYSEYRGMAESLGLVD